MAHSDRMAQPSPVPESASGVPDRLRADARRNQRRILRAAARLLAEDPAVTMQRIADECGLARLTIYRRYPTREALIAAILTEAFGEFYDELRRAAALTGGVPEILRGLIVALAEIGSNYPVLGDPPPGAMLGLPPAVVPVRDELDALIMRGQREGTVRADVPPQIIRSALLGALAFSGRTGRRANQPSADTGRQVAAIILDGVLT